jgi:hypothetical protein
MGLLDTTMELAKLAGTIANPELVQEALKANKEALELSRENLELQKRIVELEERMRQFQAQAELSAKLFRNGKYVYKDRDPTPLCSRCWDVNRKPVHIFFTLGTGLHCPECKTRFNEPPMDNPGRDAQGSIPV